MKTEKLQQICGKDTPEIHGRFAGQGRPPGKEERGEEEEEAGEKRQERRRERR